MCGNKLINIWLAFTILGLENNFNNIISVTCILCWHIRNFKFEFTYKKVEQFAHTSSRKTVYAEFLSNSTFLYASYICCC
jgi:hypothetical protein